MQYSDETKKADSHSVDESLETSAVTPECRNENALSPEILDQLTQCQQAIGYAFRNVSLLLTALMHTSGASQRLRSNERLEFLGDSVLGMVIVDLLYHTCESMMEGEMTQLKSVIVSRAACAEVSRSLNLDQYLILGKGMNRQKLPASLLANAQEAVIGAIYLDGGMDAAREYILRVFDTEIHRTASGSVGQNYKMELQQRVQRQFHQIPIYKTLDQKGPDHRRCFKVQVLIGNQSFHPAWGHSKKDAEQHAALNALCELDHQKPMYPAD